MSSEELARDEAIYQILSTDNAPVKQSILELVDYKESKSKTITKG